MMRGIISLALVVSVHGGSQCALDSSDAVQQGINAALAIWASTKRCDKGAATAAPIKCEQDIATAIEAVTAMASAIAGMAGSCDNVLRDSTDRKCGIAVNDLISATSGLAAAGGGVQEWCVDKTQAADIFGRKTLLGKCTFDGAASINSIFHASTRLQGVADGCKGEASCAVDGLDIIRIFSSFGSYIAASVADCNAYANTNYNGKDAKCAQAALSAVTQLTTVADVGINLKNSCEESASSRLYQETKSEATTTSTPMTLALAALLPMAAVVSFFAGSRFAKTRQQVSVRDTEIGE